MLSKISAAMADFIETLKLGNKEEQQKETRVNAKNIKHTKGSTPLSKMCNNLYL